MFDGLRKNGVVGVVVKRTCGRIHGIGNAEFHLNEYIPYSGLADLWLLHTGHLTIFSFNMSSFPDVFSV